MSAQTATLDRPDAGPESIALAQDIEQKPWERFPAHEGVGDKVLWKDPATGSYAGILGVAPGSSLRRHLHPHAVHHYYVLEGTCRIDGHVLTPGSYAFIPQGQEHRIEEAGPVGCTIFFLFLRTPPD